jgi:hypothetical protein
MVYVLPYYPLEVRICLLPLAILILSQAVLNFFRIRFTSPGRPPLSTDFSQPTCSRCSRSRLERSHHCSTCRQCTLQMDHHCHLVGVCIGQHNFRYFFLWLCWIVIAGAIGGLVTILPLWKLGKSTELDRNCLCFSLALCFALAIVVGLLLYSHYQNLMSGQTSVEAVRNIRTYDHGRKKNWESVFGRSRLWMFGVMKGSTELPI